jgi:release factor glutamine methyltransferase
MTDVQLPGRVDALLRQVAAALGAAGIEPRWTEARLIFELAGFDRMALINASNHMLSVRQDAIIRAALTRRLAHEPVARLRGTKPFAGRDYLLNAETLEPRDDTETLLDAVSPFVAMRKPCRILDIGTGTGILAISLLGRFPHATAVATDIAPGAIAAANANAARHGVAARFHAQLGDLFAGVAGPFDLILSNPPYIASADIAGLAPEVVNHDPHLALDGGADGLDFYRRIADAASPFLADDGMLAVEIGFDQALSVGDVFAQAGWQQAGLHHDLGGRPRVLVFRPRSTIA